MKTLTLIALVTMLIISISFWGVSTFSFRSIGVFSNTQLQDQKERCELIGKKAHWNNEVNIYWCE